MPLVMSFIRLHLREHWLQQQPLICLVQTQSYSSRPTHGQPLLEQLRFSTWSLLEAVVVVLTKDLLVVLVVAALAGSALLQDCL
jgi:hypothetical protein